METIDLKIYIHSDAQKIWDIISDHEGYINFPGISEARLLRQGNTEKNGLGAIRKIKGKGVTFIAEITCFDPPKRMEYHAKKCNLPLDHRLGRMDIIPRGQGCEVHWTSIFESKIPLIGRLLEPVSRLLTQDSFYNFLMNIKEKLEVQ